MKKLLIVIFTSFIFLFGFVSLFNKEELSYYERRHLRKFPEIKGNEDFFDDLDKYLSDHFIFRQNFREIKGFVNYDLFHISINNNVTIKDGYLLELNETNYKSLDHIINKTNEIIDNFKLDDYYFLSIPFKNKYIVGFEKTSDEISTYLSMKLNNYIDLSDLLSLEDYYRSDIHLKQNKIDNVINKILELCEIEKQDISYDKKSYTPFYGSLYAKMAIDLKPDTITYLTNDLLDSIKVYSIEDEELLNVYDEEKLNTLDPYSVYLGGPKAYLKIVNEKGAGGKLVIFRDSYASSIVPLLIPYFNQIELIDLRYYNSSLLKIDDDAKAIFIYGSEVLNNSFSIK